MAERRHSLTRRLDWRRIETLSLSAVFDDIGGSVTDSIWLQYARAALRAAMLGEPSVGIEVKRLFDDEAVGNEGIIQAVLFWVDSLIEASSPGDHVGTYPVPDIWPADMPPEQRWSVKLLGAQLNEDRATADKLLREAAAKPDQFINYALSTVIMSGMGLGSRLMPGAE